MITLTVLPILGLKAATKGRPGLALAFTGPSLILYAVTLCLVLVRG